MTFPLSRVSVLIYTKNDTIENAWFDCPYNDMAAFLTTFDKWCKRARVEYRPKLEYGTKLTLIISGYWATAKYPYRNVIE